VLDGIINKYLFFVIYIQYHFPGGCVSPVVVQERPGQVEDGGGDDGGHQSWERIWEINLMMDDAESGSDLSADQSV
jgi:hypothetical protein